jgi:hypothetical protein
VNTAQFGAFDSMTDAQISFGRVTDALPYFARHGAVSPPGANPAEFILETVGAGINARNNDKGATWASNWSASPELAALLTEIDDGVKRGSSGGDVTTGTRPKNSHNATVYEQTWLLTKRMLLGQWRNPPYMYSKIWVHVISAILVGFTFFKIGTSPQDLQNRYVLASCVLSDLDNVVTNTIAGLSASSSSSFFATPSSMSFSRGTSSRVSTG